MCVIIDANVAADVFGSRAQTDFRPLLRWLLRGDGIVVTGGKNRSELYKVGAAKTALIGLRRAGRAFFEDDALIDAETHQVAAHPALTSDDPHVIALARVSGARTLCSEDRDLHADFKNTRLVSRPRGMVYRNPEHTHLLRHTKGCRGS